jgi:hypothetical protein
MTDAHGIYIPRDLIMEGFDDDCTPQESRDTEAPTGGVIVYMLASVLAAVIGAGWMLWRYMR